VLITKVYLADHIKCDEVGGACRRHGKWERP